MEIIDKKIALFIDFDNFNNEDFYKILIEELQQMGEILYKGAFYTNINDKKMAEKAREYGVTDFVIEPTYSSGKNAVDIRIALDVSEMMYYKSFIDCFCLATNDLDFAPILKKLKLNNKIVIGAGLSSTSDNYKKICDRFISVDSIQNANEMNSNNKENANLQLLLATTNAIIKAEDKDENGYVNFSEFMKKIYIKIADFNPKNYGSVSSKPTVFFAEYLKDYYSVKIMKKAYYIKIIGEKK